MIVSHPTVIAYSAALLAMVSGVFLMFWIRDRKSKTLLWCSLPFLAGCAGGIALVQDALQPDLRIAQIGVWFVLLAYGFGWQAVRALYRRPSAAMAVIALSTLWLLLSLAVFQPWHLHILSAIMRVMIVAIFNGLAAFEFWRSRDETLPSRSILFWLFTGFTAFALLRTLLVEYLPAPLGVCPAQTWAIVTYNATAIVQALLASTFMIGLSYERVAQRNFRMANLDPLTDILNRRGLDEAVAEWGRSPERINTPTSVLLFDLDQFKAINDRFGHGIGDQVIVCAVQTAKDVLRQNDKLFRIGGEEFVCFLPRVSGRHAVTIAERLRSAFQVNAATISGHPVRATLSVGVAWLEGGHGDIDQLLNCADDALYKAKRGGRNRTVLWNEAIVPMTP